MNWLAHFIHEEIYPMAADTEATYTSPAQKPSNIEAEEPAVKKFGICGEPLTQAEKELLNKILRAINVDEEDYIVRSNVTAEAENWLVFRHNVKFEGTAINSFEVKSIDSLKIVACSPLSSLLNSQSEKRKLWDLLKHHYT